LEINTVQRERSQGIGFYMGGSSTSHLTPPEISSEQLEGRYKESEQQHEEHREAHESKNPPRMGPKLQFSAPQESEVKT
jgi:hypothetical protein